MTGLAQLERQRLSSTLTRVGPDAPTLCEGWRTRDLAAHIVLRERRPDAIAGHAATCASVGAGKLRANHAATAGWNAASAGCCRGCRADMAGLSARSFPGG